MRSRFDSHVARKNAATSAVTDRSQRRVGGKSSRGTKQFTRGLRLAGARRPGFKEGEGGSPRCAGRPSLRLVANTHEERGEHGRQEHHVRRVVEAQDKSLHARGAVRYPAPSPSCDGVCDHT